MQDPVHPRTHRWWRVSALSCKNSFLLVLLLFLIPLSLLGMALWKETKRQWQSLSIASDSLHFHQELSLLLQDVMEHQQLVQRFLLGDQSLHIAIESTQKRIDKEIEQFKLSAAESTENVDDTDLAFTRVPLPINQIINSWKALSQTEVPLSQTLNLTEHLKIVQAIRACLKILQERIALTAQEDLVMLLLDQLLYLYIPALQEEMIRFASLGQQIAHLQEPTIDMLHRFIGSMAVVQHQEAQVGLIGQRAMHLSQALNHDATLETVLKNPLSELHKSVSRWLHEVNQNITHSTAIPLDPFLILSTHALGESTQLTTSVMQQMQRLLTERTLAWQEKTRFKISLFSLILLLILGLVGYLFYNILRALKDMQHVAYARQKAGRAAPFPLNVPQELATLGSLFNTIETSSLTRMQSLQEVNKTLSHSSDFLRSLFEKQDRVLLEQKTFSHELLLQTKNLNHHAQTAKQSIQKLIEDVEQTLNALKNSKDSLQKCAYSVQVLLANSQELAKCLSFPKGEEQHAAHLIGSMTQVTDRTNLLSLNAAIQAKKAGSRSSLIADEVSRLAEQTAHTTLDLEQMIHQMSRLMQSSHERMEHILQGLESTGEHIKSCDDALTIFQEHLQRQLVFLKKLQEQMEEEDTSLQTLLQTIHPLHRTHQQTTQLLEQCHAESSHLNQQISALEELVRG